MNSALDINRSIQRLQNNFKTTDFIIGVASSEYFSRKLFRTRNPTKIVF